MITTRTAAVFDAFTISRTLTARPARVFGAFASMEAKAKWFGGGPTWKALIREMDFRIGGRERLRGEWGEARNTTDYQAYYHDIVPDQRIIYAYRVLQNDKLISISLATIEIEPAGSGSKLVLTEQGSFVDGYEDKGGREHGTNELVDRITALVDA